MESSEPPQRQSFYDAVGGTELFGALVARFYELAADDEILREAYADKMDDAEDRLRMFLEQYWGGPRTYAERRGQPRLWLRHVPLRIGPAQRDAWLRCMRTAIAEVDPATLDDEHRRELLEFLEATADSLVNAPT